MIVEVIIGCALLYLLYYLFTRPPRVNLPGPKSLPLLGNILQLDADNPHQKLSEWSEKYGGIYTIRLLSENWVVVGSYDYIHEVLVKNPMQFAGRVKMYRTNYLSFDRNDISFQSLDDHEGHFWALGRSIVQRGMKQYSTGMKQIEEVVNTMTDRFLDKQRAFDGKAHDPTDDIYNYSLAIMLCLVVGQDVNESDDMYRMAKRMERLFATTCSITGRGTELDMFPWLRFFGNSTYKKLTEFRHLVKDLWKRTKPIVLNNLDKDNPRCVMDSLLVAQETELGKHGQQKITDLNLALAQMNVVVAGVTSTSNTIMAFLGILLHYPDVQKRLQKEVDEKVGSSRPVSLDDRQAMPYTRAVLYELLRYSSIVPLFGRNPIHDTHLAGVEIKKDTLMIMNLWHLHHDEKFWDEPFQFIPERFLDEEGDVVRADHPNRKHLFAFGAGSRVCLGEMFAMARIFVFISSLMQHFDVLPNPDADLPTCDPREYGLGIVLTPPLGKIRLISRA